MPFKSIDTVYNPGEVKILGFKIAFFNKKYYATLSATQKRDAILYLDDCIKYINHYKNFIGEDILKNAKKYEVHPLITLMLTQPQTGFKCVESGFTNDSMGEIFEEDEMYYSEEKEGHFWILKVVGKPIKA
jgi:hypothetical protein